MKRSATFFWWDAWVEGWTTAVRFAETITATPVVVNRRLLLIEAAMRNPSVADHVELCTMVSEKVEAWSLAAMSLAQDYQAIQAALLQPSRSVLGASAASIRAGRLASSAAGRALAPIHQRAIANAKRLS